MTNAMSASHKIKDFLEDLFSSKNIDPSSFENVFSSMLNGDLNPAQIAAVLTAIRMKGESGMTMAAGASAMRQAATTVHINSTARPLADNCGTGGDGSHSFNISTASAIVAAAAGVRVAKHGNRSVSSKCGSADLLFAAGFPESLNADHLSDLLTRTGFTFFFAPHFHPGMKHVMPVRHSLGIRTIFNLLGPLANPIRPEVQIIGVGDRKYLEPMAEAAKNLGLKRALVVHSRDGMDEISPADKTDAAYLNAGKVTALVIDPAAYGISGSTKELTGGDASVNLAILHKLLEGRDQLDQSASVFDAVTLNSGALIWVCEKASDLASGVSLAQQVLSSGQAKSYFSNWIATAKQLAGN